MRGGGGAGGGGAGAGGGGGGGTVGGDAPDLAAPTPVTPPPVDGGVTPPPVQALDPEIATILGQVSATNLANDVATLVGFVTRNSCSDNSGGASHPHGIGAARDWLAQQLGADGLTVKLDAYSQSCPNGAQTDHNVVAWLPGKGHPDRIILIGGHYDSRTTGVSDGTSAAPGANDSGSQTSLVLEAARVLAGHSFDATLVFVAFAGEEQGLVGSKNLAQGYRQYFSPSATVEAVLNCDIVGGDSSVNDATTLQQFRLYSPGTPREVTAPDGTSDDTSPARGLMRYVGYWGAGYLPSMTIVPKLREDRPGRGGDHESFLDQGYPGVRFIEAMESPNAGTTASHQHSPNDLASFITPEYTARVARVVIATAASLARAPTPPQSLAVSAGGGGTLMASWTAPASGPTVDHYVLAGRDVAENFYRARVVVSGGATARTVTTTELGLGGATAFFVSVAAVDAAGHESLFAYPELRCAGGSCVVPAGANDVTAKN